MGRVATHRFMSGAAAAAAVDRPFDKILIANRGEIACRVIKTCKRMGIKTVAVYSEADVAGMHVRMADEAYCIGGPLSKDSYLLMDRVMEVCHKTGAQAIHPGYGFLSENAKFADMVEEQGIVFLGPTGKSMDAMGDKIHSKKLAKEAGVHTIPGFEGEVNSEDDAARLGTEIGYPVMIKASAGGGGKGMRIAYNDDEVREGFRLSKAEALSSFGDDRMLIERFIEDPHHIEIQIIADSHGNVAAFPERECSVQRRNQKVVEESPSCLIDPITRKAMQDQAIMLCKAVNYRSAGTIEMLADGNKNFYFLEMNTRLQVEHPVTEEVSGEDLVEHMLWIGSGKPLPQKFIDNPSIPFNGWSIESRVYAEDPFRKFLPSTGPLATYKEPPVFRGDEGVVRIDTGVFEGAEISMYYDPMICKLVTWAPERDTAIALQEDALDKYVVRGLGNNIPFLRSVYRNPLFKTGHYGTGFIADQYPVGFHGVTLNTTETAELMAFGAMLYRQRIMLRRSADGVDEDDVDSSDIDSLVVVVGGPKGHAYTISFEPQSNYESVKCEITPLPYTPLPNINIDHLAKMKHYGSDPLTAPTTVTLNGLHWPIESPLASFLVETDNSKPVEVDGQANSSMDAVPIRYAAQRADQQEMVVERQEVVQYAGATPEGFLLRYRGSEQEVIVRTPTEHRLCAHMKAPVVKDTSHVIMCPMPGTLISLKAAVGQAVVEGQEVAVIEAMKMQNVLRSPKDGIIKAVNCPVGAHLRVDQVIVEFEAAEEAK